MDTTTFERDLARRLSKDRHGVFPEFVSSFQTMAYSIALRTLQAPDAAAELTAESFLRASRALLGYEPRRIAALALRPWLVTIVLNACRNAARTQRRQPFTTFGTPEAASSNESPERAAERNEERAKLVVALRELPEKQKTAVVLRYVAELSYEEAAAALGRPLGTVKSDVSRGVAKLRLLLQEEDA